MQNGEYADMTTKCDLSKSFCADTVTDNEMEHLQHLFTFKHAIHLMVFAVSLQKLTVQRDCLFTAHMRFKYNVRLSQSGMK